MPNKIDNTSIRRKVNAPNATLHSNEPGAQGSDTTEDAMKNNRSPKKNAFKSLLFFALVANAFSGFSQNYQPEKVNNKAASEYGRAIQLLQDGYIREAIPVLQKSAALQSNFADAYLSLGGAYGQLKDYRNSVAAYEKARSIDSVYFLYYNLPYSINLAGLGNFAEAMNAVERFLAIPALGDKSTKSAIYRKNCYAFALDYAAKHAENNYVFAPENLGDSINSEFSEYYPSFTIDDSTLVFTRRANGIREDFIESRKIKNGYSKAVKINGSLNEEPSKGGTNISQDGEWLIFAGNFAGKGLGNFDLYISYNTPTGWSEPINMGANINTGFWESSPSVAPDKNAIYFSSDRPGGYGGRDLYVSYRSTSGKWSPAENMGPGINTNGDEIAPFIHADNKTLYYTSGGLAGYGGTDIYVTRKDDNGNWGLPENLGFPVNTIENEGSLFVAADGITAYYASDRSDSRGGLDLYKFQLRNDVRPLKTFYVQGTVTDAVTNKTIPCAVELIDNASGKTVSKVQTDETGFYFMTLPVGKNYSFTINRRGYLFYSDLFELNRKDADSIYVKDIALQPIAVNVSAVLKNILFEFNSARLQPVSLIELDKLLQLMNDNPTVKVQINGYTDNTGSDAHNIQLSSDRARSVAAYLISKGINATRITSKGFGAANPVAGNDTEEGRALNRRTTFTITGQ
ncbi:MAG TPA: OmpA family protein [Panacibacter sp.]|nr:OmpA family protein [Panacibacter sp.]HNP43889.1 OmpA family protein [Panacibacter sp.]